VYGLSGTTCEAQGRAAAIADWTGGTVDTTTGSCRAPSQMAFQSLGEVTATLGEVRHRADLVIYWGCNPAESHPRHFARYTLMPQGLFVPRGREDRTCVVIDVRRTKSVSDADIFVPIKPGKDFEGLWTLRGLANGFVPDAAVVEAETGVPLAVWQDLLTRMKRARYGALFFGTGLTATRGTHLNCEAVLSLVRDLNGFSRFVCMPMGGQGNATGADNVLTWRTGYPFGVNNSRGYPRFNPGEYTAIDVLSRREADAALIICADPMANFCQPAREHLASIPYIALDSQETATTRQATVAFASAPCGISAPGTVYRMDGVPLPLHPVLQSPYPSDYEILSRLEDHIRHLV